ncbi:DUF177 domain-containing protein [Putridiphycobacter roseus]|uniref:DUF177 domain-containing protein n=1 Tax=Putridiphycobacter roseus TaxID=2219161 RepID=A0A2W1MYD2_9FLAO|nr:DUF177 domain-containing protein [Putridiphycobacter roseus]PZE16210.1 DUF177 domain-containing protein [Putridiphycobacter roseus]
MKKDFIIGFTSLKDGLHSFDYNIDDTFFEQLDYSEIQQGDLKVHLDLEKKATLMEAHFQISGKVTLMCDRCTDEYEQTVDTENELIYKFGSEAMEDENVITVFHHEHEIDITHPIYEFIITSLPSKRLHPKGTCNESMLEIMDQYLLVGNDEEE